MLGMAVEDDATARRGPRRHRRGPGRSTCASTPTPTRSSGSTSTPAAASRSRSWCGAFNMAVGDLVPLATVGTAMPGGMEIGRRKMRGEYSQRDAVLAAPSSSSPTTRGGILVLARRRRPGHADPRGARHRARRPLGPRGQPEPARRHVGGRASPATSPPARRAVRRCPSPTVAAAARRRRRRVGRGPRPRPVRAVHRRACSAASRSARRRPLIATPADAARHAPDQQRGRRVELRDARARPAQPPLRPRQLAGRAFRVRRGARRRDPRDPRRRRAPLHRRRPAHLRRRRQRRSASPGSWAARHRDLRRRPPTCSSRWRGSSRIAIAKTSRRLGAAQRGLGPLREGLPTPRSSTSPSAASSSCSARGTLAPGIDRRARRAARRARRSGSARRGSTRLLGTTCAPSDVRAELEPDRVRLRAGRTATTTSSIPSWRPDCARRDRPRRGGRPPLRLRAHRPARCRPRPASGALTPLPAAIAGGAASPRRPRLLRGDADAVPRARRPGPRRPRRRRHHDHQPARRRGVGAPHVAAARAAQVGRLQRSSHRIDGVAPVRDRSRLPPPGRRATPSCPTSASTSASPSPEPRPPAAVEVWRALGRRTSACRRRRCERRRRARPAPDRGRRSSSVDGDRSGAVGEVDPGVLDAFGIDRPGRVARGRPRRPARPSRTATDPFVPFSRFPSSDIDLAFEVPDERRRRPRSLPAIDGAGERAARRRRACSTSTGATAWPRAAGASPTGCGSRPPTAPSPTPRSARPARQSSPPSRAAVPAKLRG